jgi:ABC-type polysaccharide/polyol phosphate transport system ATPase subunit
MTGGPYAIEVRNLSKSFRVYHERTSTLFEHLVGIISKKKRYEKLNVLDDISFEVKKGEMIGIIAKNGQGKTTLLQIMSKILQPDSGTVNLHGSTVPFLGLGSGFQPDLTAIDNIILHGLFLGLSKGLIKQKLPEILKYAELERFADTKLRHFSAGMYARLAFATGVQVDPDILLVDEVLSVGDVGFQEKGFQTFLSFKKRGKTIVFVTHNLEQVKRLCDRAILIHDGKIQKIGLSDDVVAEFYNVIRQ